MPHRSTRALLLTAALVGAALPLAAQAVPDRASAVEYRKQFLIDLDTLQTKLVALANAVPAGKYSWRPAEGVRSFGEVFMHIASEHYIFTPMSFGAPRSQAIPRGQDALKKFEANSSKDSVLKYLNEGYAYTKASLAAVPDDSLVGMRKLFGRDYNVMETGIGMTADLHEHLGQLIAYARMNGITPPWSK